MRFLSPSPRPPRFAGDEGERLPGIANVIRCDGCLILSPRATRHRCPRAVPALVLALFEFLRRAEKPHSLSPSSAAVAPLSLTKVGPMADDNSERDEHVENDKENDLPDARLHAEFSIPLSPPAAKAAPMVAVPTPISPAPASVDGGSVRTDYDDSRDDGGEAAVQKSAEKNASRWVDTPRSARRVLLSDSDSDDENSNVASRCVCTPQSARRVLLSDSDSNDDGADKTTRRSTVSTLGVGRQAVQRIEPVIDLDADSDDGAPAPIRGTQDSAKEWPRSSETLEPLSSNRGWRGACEDEDRSTDGSDCGSDLEGFIVDDSEEDEEDSEDESEEEASGATPARKRTWTTLPVAAERGAWACAACTFENVAGDVACAVCEAPRRSKPASMNGVSTTWACAACTFENVASVHACAICETPRSKPTSMDDACTTCAICSAQWPSSDLARHQLRCQPAATIAHADSEAEDEDWLAEQRRRLEALKPPKPKPKPPKRTKSPPLTAAGRPSLSHNQGWDAKLRDELRALAPRVFREYNQAAFGGKLPADTRIFWSARASRLGGYCRFLGGESGWTTPAEQRRGVSDFGRRKCEIMLSERVCDTEARMRDVLAHEMCHAAQWCIDGQGSQPHGAVFKKWGRVVETSVPGMKVWTTHRYDVFYKFIYACAAGCGAHCVRGDHQPCGRPTPSPAEQSLPRLVSARAPQATRSSGSPNRSKKPTVASAAAS